MSFIRLRKTLGIFPSFFLQNAWALVKECIRSSNCSRSVLEEEPMAPNGQSPFLEDRDTIPLNYVDCISS